MPAPMDGVGQVFMSGHKCSIHLLAIPPSLAVRTFMMLGLGTWDL